MRKRVNSSKKKSEEEGEEEKKKKKKKGICLKPVCLFASVCLMS